MDIYIFFILEIILGIAIKIQEKKENITEAEKNEIIAQCCKEQFEI